MQHSKGPNPFPLAPAPRIVNLGQGRIPDLILTEDQFRITLATFGMVPVAVLPFKKATAALRSFSRHGGDEDWVIVSLDPDLAEVVAAQLSVCDYHTDEILVRGTTGDFVVTVCITAHA